MKYSIEYEHLKDELATNDEASWHFDKVKKSANKNNLELLDEEFKHFFKLQLSNEDIGWIMHKMNVYKTPFIDALISYITY